MAFNCYVRLNAENLGQSAPEEAIVVAWHVEKGALCKPGDSLGTLQIDGNQFQLVVQFKSYVASVFVQPGSVVQREDQLVELWADGEEIPTGFKYCHLKS